ncbi:hypothetical protein L1049_019930 [Liquidambar formosana]|uniref:WD repeat-containing protein 44 n=1 Tax=Liquidambar formosana TaxID=63359 RepID=A0AAP0S6F5_LIQFO
MMGSFIEDDGEEYRFFDAHDEVASLSVSDSGSYCNESFDCNSELNNWISSKFRYDVWIRSPGSIRERRDKFLSWLGLSSDQSVSENSVDVCSDALEREIDRITASSGAMLSTSGFEDEFRSSRSSVSCWSNDASDLSGDLGLKENFVCRIGNLDGGMERNVDRLWQDGELSKVREVGSDGSVLAEEFENTSGSSPSFQKLLHREIEEASTSVGTKKRVKKGWLSRLRSMACIEDRQGEVDSLGPNDPDSIRGARVQRVRVRQHRKQLKELSALYMGQDIQAHEGSILTMKFSPDGQYLASGGEDGVVRLWQVMEDERSNELDIPDIDPSCIYFTVNHLSELSPLFVDKEKMVKLKNLKKTSDSACVIFPPKVFRILEKPLHEFHGHSGDILDLSWSRNNCLLSSSVDKTVRLWQVGCNNCLKVFSHNNYVTCVQFNPVDDDYFISGSIDGKVRIWAISSRQVFDWADIREIVTAVCYRPNAQGVIVGSMTGNCLFYNLSDKHLQLDAQISLHSKKKSPGKRITGFQFLPQDPSRVMVTCADSQVRILHGINVIGKYRGLRKAGNQIFASVTSDGKHIVSACEDSNVYVWNCSSQEEPAVSQAKNIKSCERFSTNASVAIPWYGLKHGNSESGCHFDVLDDNAPDTLPSFSPACFSLSQEFFLESFPKGSATWPEEKLPTSSSLGSPCAISKSQYKFFKASCQCASSSHAWGLVIVTAGWDGRIRSFHNYGLPVPL